MAKNTQTKSSNARENNGGVLGRKRLYALVANRAQEVVAHLFNTMNNEKAQDSVRLSAANKLIDKILPNLASTDMSAEMVVELKNVLEIPAKRSLDTPPKTDTSPREV